jgi:hypothetical protein
MSKFKIKLDEIPSEYVDYYETKKVLIGSGDQNITICQSAFSNCQNLVIGNFQALVGNCKPEELTTKLLEIKALSDHFAKSIAVIDVRESVFKTIEGNVPILRSMPYVSSNGSSMVMAHIDFRLINLKNFVSKASKVPAK